MLRPGVGEPVVVKEKFPSAPTVKVVFGSLVKEGAVWAIATPPAKQTATAILHNKRNTGEVGVNALESIVPAAETGSVGIARNNVKYIFALFAG